MRVSETGALPNHRAAYKPPKPPPTITTRCADAIAYGMQKPAELILRYASPNMGHRVGLDMTDAGRHRYGMATIPPRGFYGDDQFPESPRAVSETLRRDQFRARCEILKTERLQKEQQS